MFILKILFAIIGLEYTLMCLIANREEHSKNVIVYGILSVVFFVLSFVSVGFF